MNHRIGIELIQVRTGPSVGKPTYRGIQHLGGTREAVEEELRAVLVRMRMRRSGLRRGTTTITSGPIEATAAGPSPDRSSTGSCDDGRSQSDEGDAEIQELDDEDDSGEAIRLRVEAMRKRYFDSWKSGRARHAMLAFSQYF